MSKTAEGVEYRQVPCLMIHAAEQGWFDQPDFQEWLAKGDVAHWPLEACGDVFVTWNHGSGSDDPGPMKPSPGVMPQWLWDEIKKVVADASLTNGYAVIRLMGA